MVQLDTYTLVFLRRPAGAPDLPEAELERLQLEHLAFLASMRDAGHALVTGPLRGADESLRGLVLYRVPVDEALRLSGQDPSVRAGRLEAEAYTWMVVAGTLGERPVSKLEV